jgi:hypothetical protein
VNPGFVDEAHQNFALLPNSPALNAGAHLAHTMTAGHGTTIVPVDDSLFFTDGYGIVGGDVVQIGSNPPVQIINVDNAGNTLTVASPVSFNLGDTVDLPFSGSAPNIGPITVDLIHLPAAAPVISPSGGTFQGSVSVSIQDGTPGSEIYFTTNGTPPTQDSTLYTSSFTLTANATVEAVAFAPSYTTSSVTTASFIVGSNPATPILSVSPASMNFVATLGGLNPNSQTLQISNTGTASMNWTADTMASSWLGVTPKAGTIAAGANQTITLSVNSVNLSTGNYQDALTVTAPGATHSPLSVPITLSIVSAQSAILSLSQTAFNFNVSPGGGIAPPQTASLTNVGGTPLSWFAFSTTSTVIASPGQGTLAAGESVPFTLSISPSKLSAGTYTQAVLLFSPNAVNNLLILWATITVAGPPPPNGNSSTEPPLSTIRVFPNPWRQDQMSGNSMTLDGLTPGSLVTLFTLSGHKVASLTASSSGAVQWEPETQKMASGIYLYVVNDQGRKTSGKFAIIR